MIILSLSLSNNELKTRTEMEQRAKLAAKTRADKLGAHISRTLLPIAECDRNLNVIEWIAAAEATLGYRHKDVRGQHLTSLLLPADAIRQLQSDAPYVVVNRAGEATRVAVRTGLQMQGRVQILHGVTPGDEVILTREGEAGARVRARK